MSADMEELKQRAEARMALHDALPAELRVISAEIADPMLVYTLHRVGMSPQTIRNQLGISQPTGSV